MKKKFIKQSLLGIILLLATTACEKKPVPKVTFQEPTMQRIHIWLRT